MTQSSPKARKLERIETLLRVLGLVVIVASCISSLRDARVTLGASIAYLAWIVISAVGAGQRVGGGRLQSWWVVGIDAVLISTALLFGRAVLDELALMALMVPIGILTLRGKLLLALLLAVFATAVAYVLNRYGQDFAGAPADPLNPRVIAHTLAWLSIFSMVAFSSRAGYRFLQVADLEESEADVRLDGLLVRAQEILSAPSHRLTVKLITEVAREVFEADSASIMQRREGGMHLLGLSRQARYIDPAEGEDVTNEKERHEALTRVSIADFVAYNEQPLLLNQDLVADPRFRNIEGRSGIHSAMSVPVVLGDKLYGVLNVSRLDPLQAKFGEGDLRVARVLSYIAAIALGRHQAR